jgi:hypothetical protein
MLWRKSMTSRPIAPANGARCALLALVAVAAASAGPMACGGAPTAPQAPASSAAAPAAVALPPAPDLSLVPPPPGLVLSATIANLGASLATVHGWTQFPMPQADRVTEIIAGQELGAIADLDRPIHVAVSVTGVGAHLSKEVAVSAAVRDVDAAKAALAGHYELTAGGNGALLIQRLGRRSRPSDDSDDSDSDDANACELAPSYGDPAFRLVCGWDAKALATLGPWLTRGATREASTTDLHVELRMQPLRATIDEERRSLSMLVGMLLAGRAGKAGERELLQALGAAPIDFVTDLDTATLDLALSDPGAAATLTLRLSGTTSALARLATANADRNGPPPAPFWQMPGDADLAVFDRGIDPNALARGRDLVLKVMADKLADDGVKDADRHALVDALGALVSPAPMVYSAGIDADAARKALAIEKALPDGASAADRRAATRAIAQALLGWRVLEIDEPAAGRVDAMKAIAAALARPGVFAAYHGKPGVRALAMRAAPLPRGKALPKGTEHFVIDVPLPEVVESAPPKAAPAGPPRPMEIDVFVAPDGARCWIGAGGDPALVAAKLGAAAAGSGDVLGARPELASMKDAVVGAGGFLTARGLPEVGVEIGAFGGGDMGAFGTAAALFEGGGQLPHQGVTPIPFSLTAPAATPGTVVATLQVPRGTVDDVVMTLLQHGF